MRKVDLLTEKQVRNARPDSGKFVKRLHDGAGLYLQAHPLVGTASIEIGFFVISLTAPGMTWG